MTSVVAPGLRAEIVVPPPVEDPLRTDIAGFVGQCRRGPLGKAVRVDGWRAFAALFGGLEKSMSLAYSVRGYFENGGEVAWIRRVIGVPSECALATWDTSAIADDVGFESLRVVASSPGAWANDTTATFFFRRQGVANRPEVDVTIRAPGEPIETILSVPPAQLVGIVAAQSKLVRLVPGPVHTASGSPALPGPRVLSAQLKLSGGTSPAPVLEDYLAAFDAVNDVGEVAVVCAPDLHESVTVDRDRAQAVQAMLAGADALRDRLVLVDVPPEHASGSVADLEACVTALGRTDGDSIWRSGALYHPHLVVLDPLGGPSEPTRRVPASGHVAGAISSLDRERGAHHTPANVSLVGAVDIAREYDCDEHAVLNVDGVNIVRCSPGRGIEIWGGRTLDRDQRWRFVAHRRLIHRLVRAMRGAAEPLVFDTNGPALWFSLVRAVTGVLLEAWRAGALAGVRPEEAFRVQCDEDTNPPSAIDEGQCVCLVEVAPATPMEFILIRIAMTRDGTLEVVS